MKKHGFFISFEGGEGSGKTTQSKLLVKGLQADGIGAIWTKEPGSPHIPICGKFRELLLDPENEMDSFTEALIFSADRSEHTKFLKSFKAGKLDPVTYQTILASVKDKAGIVAVTDRYVDSTNVYQFSVHNLDPSLYGFIMSATRGLMPDLSFLCHIEAETGLERSQDKNRFEQKGLDYHKKVNESFLIHAKCEPERFVIVDASKSIEELQKEIYLIVMKKLEKAGLLENEGVI